MVVSNIFGIFIPKFGEDSHFDEHIFQMGGSTTNILLMLKNPTCSTLSVMYTIGFFQATKTKIEIILEESNLFEVSNGKRAPGYLGDLLGMKSYPVMWGL